MIEQMSDEELLALLSANEEQPAVAPASNDQKILDIYDPAPEDKYKNISDEELMASLAAEEQPASEKVAPEGFNENGDPISTSIGRTVLDQSLQGLPLVGTFSDEVMSSLGGLGASAYLNYRNNMPEWAGGFAPGLEIDSFTTDQLLGEANKLGNERVAKQIEENPGTAIASQLASGLLTGGALLKSAGAAPTLFEGSADVADKASKIYNWAGRGNALTRTGKIAATGIPAGYLYGLGDDSGEGRLDNAEDSALWGALPAALPIVGSAARGGKKLAQGTGKVAAAAKQAVLPPEPVTNATNKILQRLADDNMTLEGLEARLARSPGSAIVDVGRGNLERLTEASSNLPGSGANNAVRFVSKRLSNEPKQIKSAVNDFIASGDFHGTKEKIISEAEEKVKPLYKEVYAANPSVESKEIDRILTTPAGKAALKSAAELMLNDRKLLGYTDPELLEQAKLAGQEIEGGVATGLKMQTLDYVKRAMDDAWNKAPYGTNERRILNNLRKDMVNALDEADASGKYKEARKIWAGSMSGQEAMETAREFMKMDTHELKTYFNGLGESEKELFKLGAAQNIRDTINAAPDRTNMAKKIFGRQEYRDNLQAIMGRKEFNQLRASLMRQEKQHLLNNRLLGNSRTALRSAEMQDLNVMDPEAATALLSGNPMSFMMKSMKNNVLAKATGLNRDTAGNVTSMMFETDPVKQKEIINQLKAAQAARNAPGPLQSLIANGKKLVTP